MSPVTCTSSVKWNKSTFFFLLPSRKVFWRSRQRKASFVSLREQRRHAIQLTGCTWPARSSGMSDQDSGGPGRCVASAIVGANPARSGEKPGHTCVSGSVPLINVTAKRRIRETGSANDARRGNTSSTWRALRLDSPDPEQAWTGRKANSMYGGRGRRNGSC